MTTLYEITAGTTEYEDHETHTTWTPCRNGYTNGVDTIPTAQVDLMLINEDCEYAPAHTVKGAFIY